MNFEQFFREKLGGLKTGGRYRMFADLERQAGRYPRALWRERPDGPAHQVAIWCSNDYLAMGPHPDVIAAMQAAIA